MDPKVETVVPINGDDGDEVKAAPSKSAGTNPLAATLCCHILGSVLALEHKKVIHSIKVGMALALVSLLYIIQPVYDRVGDNAMWAIMTVVVVFEFSAGATLSKGLNRGAGTVAGGGLGCLAAILAREVGYVTRAVAVGVSVFIVGGAATYTRLVPNMKRKYDYGVMIFILTFNLVAVSGFRAKDVIELACDRLLTIAIGFAVCILISLFFFPVWAGDELHHSIANKFDILANSLEECVVNYFRPDEERRAGDNIRKACTSVLYSKAADDALANFATWELWHGNFGFSRPGDKCFKIAELLRELAACIFTLEGMICIRSSHKQISPLRMIVQEPCIAMSNLLSSRLMELKLSLQKTQKTHLQESMMARLSSTTAELRSTISSSLMSEVGNQNAMVDNGAVISFVSALFNMADKVERLAKEVEGLNDIAGFSK